MGRSPANMGGMRQIAPQPRNQQHRRPLLRDHGAIAVQNDAFSTSNGRVEAEKRKGNHGISDVGVGFKRKHSDQDSGKATMVKEEVVEESCVEVRAAARVEDEETESEVGDSSDEEAEVDYWRVQQTHEEAPKAPVQQKADAGVANSANEARGEAVDVEEESPREKHAQRRPQIELPKDEALMEAIVDAEPMFANRERSRMLTWDAIASACGPRFGQNGNRVKRRVQWLEFVWKDRNHPLHSQLTESLRRSLKAHSEAKARGGRSLSLRERVPIDVREAPGEVEEGEVLEDDTGGRDSCRGGVEDTQARGANSVDVIPPRCEREQGGELEEHATEEEDERFRGIDRGSGAVYGEFDASLEEKVLRIVLKHAPRFATTTKRAEIWEAIARDSRGRYKSGSSACYRTTYLCRITNDPLHPMRTKISPTLRAMLLEVMKMLQVKRDTSRQRDSEVKKAPRRKQTPSAQASSDELLLKLVLEKRLFAQNKGTRAVIWSEIVKSLQSPRIHDGKSGHFRVRYLIGVYQDPDHHYHEKLTDTLCDLLDKYIRAQADFQANPTQESSSTVATEDVSQGRSLAEQQPNVVAPEPPVVVQDSTPSLEPAWRRSTRKRVPVQLNLTLLDPYVEEQEEGKEGQEEEQEEEATRTAITPTSEHQTSETERGIADTQQSGAVSSLLIQVTELQKIQREQHRELHSLVTMLKEERDFHRQETSAMLKLIKAEREDRKREFEMLLEDRKHEFNAQREDRRIEFAAMMESRSRSRLS